MKLFIYLSVIAITLWIAHKLIGLRNRPVHDTETDGRIDDSGYGEKERTK